MADDMEDDQIKLLRLLSLVFKTSGPGVAIRFPTEQHQLDWHTRNKEAIEKIEAVMDRGGDLDEAEDPEWARFPAEIHLLGSYFKDALECRAGDKNSARDAQELPMFTIETMGQVTEKARAILGQVVRHSLHLREIADSQRLGELWIDEVVTTAWRLLVKRQSID
jgi:hypothetical protein